MKTWFFLSKIKPISGYLLESDFNKNDFLIIHWKKVNRRESVLQEQGIDTTKIKYVVTESKDNM